MTTNVSWSKPDLKHLPKEITSQELFCVWKEVAVKDGESKPQKVPYTFSRMGVPKQGFNYGRCCTFTKLQNVLKKLSGFYPGFLMKNSDLTVIDIDNYHHNPELLNILMRLRGKGCYVEVSPSGKGFHIFYSGYLNWTNGRNKCLSAIHTGQEKNTTCEVYSYHDLRFITLTGQCLNFYDAPLPSLPKPETIKDELMELKNKFFVDPNEKVDDSSIINNSTSFSQLQDSVKKNDVDISRENSSKLEVVLTKIKSSKHYKSFVSFISVLKEEKYESISEADMAFAGLIVRYIDEEWELDDKVAVIVEAFYKYRKQRDKIQNRSDYIFRTASQALSDAGKIYFRNTELKQSAPYEQVSNTINRSSIFKICNIMQIFHLGKSYANFQFVNEKNKDNSLSVTAPQSLNHTDQKYFMHILFQYKQLFPGNQTSTENIAFELNVASILGELGVAKCGKQYKRLHDSLVRLSKVHLQYHKLIDSSNQIYCEYTGSLLSFQVDYERDRYFINTRKWNKIKIELGRPILEIMNSAQYNYALLNKDSYYSLASSKLQLLYFYLCQNTLPGKGPKIFTAEDLLTLWPYSNIRSTINSREKELNRLIEEFIDRQKNIKDLAIESIYDHGKLMKIKVKKKNLKPI